MKSVKIGLSALVLMALSGAQAAQAQAQQCVTEAEVSALAIYAVPSAIKGVQTGCAASLTSSGFLATGGNTMATRYAALGDETWPQAKRVLLQFATKAADEGSASQLGEMTDLFDTLPDQAVRPLIDAVILQKVAQEVKPGSCRNVERVLSVLSRFDPRDTGALVGVILSVVDLKEPRLCPLEGA
jgi:hypothetical protein